MLADDVDGLLKFLEKSSLQLSNWLDTEEERATRKCYKRQRSSSSSTTAKNSPIKWPLAIKKSQTNNVKDCYRLQTQSNKPGTRRRNRKTWVHSANSDSDSKTTNTEPDQANSGLNLDRQQHHHQQPSPNLSNSTNHNDHTSIDSANRLAHQGGNLHQVDSLTGHHHNVLDGQLSLVIPADELTSIDLGGSISPNATHLSPIDSTIHFQSIHQQHYYPIQKHQIIDSYSHGLHDEPFSNADHMQMTSSNLIEHNSSHQHHSHHHHHHHHLNHHSEHQQSGQLDLSQLDHGSQHGHNDQQQHEHINDQNHSATEDSHHHLQHQHHHSHHHHHQHQHSQNNQHHLHGQLSCEPKQQQSIAHQTNELSSTLHSLTSIDCYQIQGSANGQTRQHPAQFSQHVDQQWLTPVASNAIAGDDAFHLVPTDGIHLDQVVVSLDSPGGHQSLDQVHFGVPLYHHSYYGHHQGDQLGSFQSQLGDDSYTSLGIQSRSNGIGVPATTSRDTLTRAADGSLGLTNEHGVSPQQQQSSSQLMPQLQNLDLANVNGNQANFSMTNGSIGGFDRHVQIHHNSHSIDQQSLQQDYNHSSNSHRLQQHHVQLVDHHPHNQHELHQQIHQHNHHSQHHQQQISLINGLEPNGVILQDINLASASWSSPEDLYTI